MCIVMHVYCIRVRSHSMSSHLVVSATTPSLRYIAAQWRGHSVQCHEIVWSLLNKNLIGKNIKSQNPKIRNFTNSIFWTVTVCDLEATREPRSTHQFIKRFVEPLDFRIFGFWVVLAFWIWDLVGLSTNQCRKWSPDTWYRVCFCHRMGPYQTLLWVPGFGELPHLLC